MPKATRAKDTNETPKKRSLKAKPADGNGTEVVEPVTTAPAIAGTTSKVSQVAVKDAGSTALPSNGNHSNRSENGTKTADAKPIAIPEELVRRRAYELYLQRRGQGGSPEQDWFQALQEISARHVA
jgi:hypothetical protein